MVNPGKSIRTFVLSQPGVRRCNVKIDPALKDLKVYLEGGNLTAVKDALEAAGLGLEKIEVARYPERVRAGPATGPGGR